MRVGIVGTGAMASLFAARLNAVADVVIVGTWQAQIDTLNANGLTVVELDGSSAQHHFVATSQPSTLEPVDVALILTKDCP